MNKQLADFNLQSDKKEKKNVNAHTLKHHPHEFDDNRSEASYISSSSSI